MTTKQQYDTIVIGGGLAGLTASAQLARAGNRTLLLERNSQLGGRARTDELDGLLFNQGGHAFYCSGAGYTTLQSLGIEPDGVAPPLAGAQLAFADTTTALPLGALSLARTKALKGTSKPQFTRLLATLPKLDATSYADVTVDTWLAPMRPDVQQLVKALVRLSTYTADTAVMSADAAISQLAASLDGVLYLHRGWAALCDQIASVAAAAGATILTGKRVASVTTGTGTQHVTTDDDHFTATSIIVAAGGPAFTTSLLGLESDHLGPVGPAPHAAVLDLVLDAMPAKHRFVLGLDEPTYFSVNSPPARPMLNGKVAAVAMRYLSQDDDRSADDHRASLTHVAKLAGVGEPLRTRFLRRMTVTNGMPIASAGGMAERPGVAVPRRPGVFIAGDWVGPRGLLADAAIASGFDAALAVQEHVQRAPSGTLA